MNTTITTTPYRQTSDKIRLLKVSNSIYEFDLMNSEPLCKLQFQKGPRAEVGINGITVDDLFAACIDHLKGWQATELACGYNTKIIALLEQALHECNLRHAERAGRGVTGTSKP